MAYFDRMGVSLKPKAPTVAERLKKLEEDLFGPSSTVVTGNRRYGDDDLIASGLGGVYRKTANEKHVDDQVADRALRLLI